jgi:hypothetical protein
MLRLIAVTVAGFALVSSAQALNARAAAAAGGNDYTSPLRLRPIQNPRSGFLRGQDHYSADPQGSPQGLPQGHLLSQ